MTPPSAPAAFEITRTVAEADLDDSRHVNNVVYVRWVQDVAVAHWEALAPPADRAAIGWVLLRHEVDYLAPAVLGDALVLRTWVGSVSGVQFERHTEIRRVGDGRILARSRTLWCPVDRATGRPRRPGAALRALFSVPPTGDVPARGAPAA